MPTAIGAPALVRGQDERRIRDGPRRPREPELARELRPVVDAPVAHQHAQTILADERLALEPVLGSRYRQLLTEARAAKGPEAAPVTAVIRQGRPHCLQCLAGKLVAMDRQQSEDRAHYRLRSQCANGILPWAALILSEISLARRSDSTGFRIVHAGTA